MFIKEIKMIQLVQINIIFKINFKKIKKKVVYKFI